MSFIAQKKINQKTKLKGGNGLLEAIKKGNITEVRILLQEEISKKELYKALEIEQTFGNKEIKNLLIQKLLFDSAKRNDITTVLQLIGIGANIHANKEAALRIAIQNKHLNMIKLLLDKGADMMVGSDTTLREAYRLNDLDVVQLLLLYDKENMLWSKIKRNFLPLYDKLLAKKLLSKDHKCTKGILQATGTCYYNAALNGIVLSPKLYRLALLKLKEYIEYLKSPDPEHTRTITCKHMTDTKLHLKIPIRKKETSIQKEPNKPSLDEYDEYILDLSSKIITEDNPIDPIVVTFKNMDEVATFMVMKLLYLYRCNNSKLQEHLETTRTFEEISEIISIKCPFQQNAIVDYIQLLSTFTLKLHKNELTYPHDLRNNELYPTKSGFNSGTREVSLFLEKGGYPVDAFKTILKYIFGHQEYVTKVIRLDIKSDPTPTMKIIKHIPEIFILTKYTGYGYYDPDYSEYFGKIPKPFILKEIHPFYISNEILNETIEIHNTQYLLDHISLDIKYTKGYPHALTAIICEYEDTRIPMIVDSNNPSKIYPINWFNVDNLFTELRKIPEFQDIRKIEISYICYVQKDKYKKSIENLDNPDSYCRENSCEMKGGNQPKKYTYKKKQYTKYTSSKGTFIIIDGLRRYLTLGGKLKRS